jgi:hypothetical protein
MLFVIPAKTGIQCFQALINSWTSFFNGVTTFYKILKYTYRNLNVNWISGVFPIFLFIRIWCPVRARRKKPVKHGEEYSPFHVKLKLPVG